jgi:acyl-CoA dehydrogenase
MFDTNLTAEQQELIKTARQFALKEMLPVAQKLDDEGKFPDDIFQKAWEVGLRNLELPQDIGGMGLTCFEHCLILEELNYACTGITTSLAGSSLGSLPLLIAGNEMQKKRFLGQLISEPVHAAYGCSEPDAGSDVANMRTKYEKHGDEYVLTGQKRWITNGVVAAWYVIFATSDPKLRHKGISCFVVPAGLPGLRPGKKEDKMGQRASNTTDVIMEEVKIPKEYLVGQEGEGFKIAMKTFDRSRPWIAAGATGIMRRCLDESRQYALQRKTFGVAIAQHQAIQFILADMAISYEATRLLMLKAAYLVDQGSSDSVVSAYAKAFGADAAMKVATDAVQVFGGYGYTKEYPVEKLMRDAKLLQIYEGTSQIQRMVIARHILGVR